MSVKRTGKRKRERERRQRRAERRAEVRARSEAKGGSSSGPPPDAAPSAAEPKTGREPELIDAALCWHIARMSPGKGSKALVGLKGAKVAVFRPRASEVVVRRGRRVVRRTPLLLRTAFIGVTGTAHLDEARALPGIAEIVSSPEPDTTCKGNIAGFVMTPARIDPDVLQGFANRLAKGEIVQPLGVAEGDQVIVDVGPFASFPGVVEAILPDDKVKVGVAIFGRSTPHVLGIAEIRVVA